MTYDKNNLDPNRCKAMVSDHESWIHFYQCSRKPKKDGYCTIHHPDYIKKKEKEKEERYQKEWDNAPRQKLARALEKIKELEMENEKLRKKLYKSNLLKRKLKEKTK